MKSITLAILGALFLTSHLAQAQYSCSDIPNIQAILTQLQQNCGGSTQPAGYCKAKGYIGNTAESVIAQCSASGTPYGRGTCIADLTCTPNAPGYCIAKEYLANSYPAVIAQCSASGTPYGRGTCIAAAVCKGIVPPYCVAKEYIGNTAEEAVAACSASGTPYGRQTCVDALVCR